MGNFFLFVYLNTITPKWFSVLSFIPGLCKKSTGKKIQEIIHIK